MRILLLLLFSTYIYAGTIRVAVAANVSYAIKDVIQAFNIEHTNIKVEVNIGSSGKLAAQILHNAPYDIFMSADMNYPQYIYNSAKAEFKPKVYARGSLALFTKRDNIDLNNTIGNILSKNIKKIAIANAKTAPYGVATKEALENLQLYSKLKDKFIYAESIGQTLTYALTAADIAFVAKSSLLSEKLSKYKKGKNWIDVPQNIYTPTKQGVVLIKESKNRADAKVFYDYILSDRAKKIFKKYGYIYR